MRAVSRCRRIDKRSCCELLFLLQKTLYPCEFAGDDDLSVLGDRGFVSVERPYGVATRSASPLQSALNFDSSPFQQSDSRGRSEMSSKGEAQGEVPRIIGVDIRFEELFEEVFSVGSYFVDLPPTRPAARKCKRGDLGSSTCNCRCSLSGK